MPKVRVSVANLAWYVRPRGGLTSTPFAILNASKLKKGERQFGALGGGAMLTEYGKKLLELNYEASDFELDPHTGYYDARFVIDETQLDPVFAFFARIAGQLNESEHDPTLDILAELCGEEDPEYTILSKESVASVVPKYLRAVEQAPAEAGTDTSARASAKIPTRRLFRIYELIMPPLVYYEFISSMNTCLLTEEELSTTNYGATAGHTKEGTPMQNNLFLAKLL